jgi:hypothetical protein
LANGITTIETLYRRKSPETAWHEEYFELTMGEQTVDDQLGYFVRETQCWWDAAGKRTVRVQYTLSPRGGFATLEEAHERYELQRATRARRGFVHSFAPRYHAAGRYKYVRIEIPAPESANEDQGHI